VAKSSIGKNKPKATPVQAEAVATNSHSAKDGKAAKATRRASVEAHISPSDRVCLYAGADNLSASLKREVGLQLPFVTYFQDPSLAKKHPDLAFDERFFVDWEPGLADGPTSARFAIVDYNGDSGTLTAPAEWDEAQQRFAADGKVLEKDSASTFQFHQVSVWALLQRALAFFEDGNGLGRRIPWGFEGNRLIVVPHAGYGENAYYDRGSKSLQFYYFGDEHHTIYTCLSADIVNHEFGHAVLDGVRPLLNESAQIETAAFHESVGDVTAILLALRNNDFREQLARKTKGKMAKADALSSIAEEFGKAVTGKPYLRSARKQFTMSELANASSAHELSVVLTGAMFDILVKLAEHYQRDVDDAPATDSAPSGNTGARATPLQAFWRAADRMQRTAIQPLDLLPPVEVTFRDYALAVCRAQQLSSPMDPHNYYDMLIKVFRNREILTAKDEERLRRPQYLYNRLQLSVVRDVNEISRSRAAAYRFLDDNREDLLIPANRDFFVCDLYDANKLTRQAARMPRQIVLQYAWREDVLLDGSQFGQFNGQVTTLLCGGTLVFDDNGIVLSWVFKPGSMPYRGKRVRGGIIAKLWAEAVDEGTNRRQALLDNLARQIAEGRIGTLVATEKGLLGALVPPLVAEGDDGTVQFRIAPHMHLSEQHQLDDDAGARRWEVSC
jgi:hypothetical protein